MLRFTASSSLAPNGYLLQTWDRVYAAPAARGREDGSSGEHGDCRKSLDIGDFRHAASGAVAWKSGHLSGLAYMAGRTDEHRASRYITRRSTTHTR